MRAFKPWIQHWVTVHFVHSNTPRDTQKLHPRYNFALLPSGFRYNFAPEHLAEQ